MTSKTYMEVRDYLWGEYVLAHHEPDHRAAIAQAHERVVVLLAEFFDDFVFEVNILEQCDFLLVRPAPNVDFEKGLTAAEWWKQAQKSTPRLLEGGQLAAAMGKKIGLLGPVESWRSPNDDPDFITEFGNFEAARSEIVAEHEGLWCIVGNAPVGNVDQAWLDLFLTPELERTGKEGKHALGLNEYFYFWPGFLIYPYLAQKPNGVDAVLPADRVKLPPVPVASPEKPVEAWMVGRFQWTMKLPRWWPVFFPEGGGDKIAPHQVSEWDAPFVRMEDGEPVPFSGINTLEHRIDDVWGDAGDGVRYYAHEYLAWLNEFYSQFEQVYGVGHFGTGPHYTQAGKDKAQFAEYDIDAHGGGAVLRKDIADSGWKQVVAPWDYAAHVLDQDNPDSLPDDDPPTPNPTPLLERLQGLALSEAFWGHVIAAVALSVGALLDVEPEMVEATIKGRA